MRKFVFEPLQAGLVKTMPWLAEASAGRRHRVMLWSAITLCVLSVIVALTLPEDTGPAVFVLTFGIAAVLFVILYAMAAGSLAHRNLSPGARREGQAGQPMAMSALEALPEAQLITNAKGVPVFANAAYRALAKTAGALGQSRGPVSFERIVGAHPGLSAAVFRLARAARNNTAHEEHLPAFEGAMGAHELDVRISPLPGGEALWSIAERRLGQDGDAVTPPVHNAMFDDLPVGVFCVDTKGRIASMNAPLRSWLGLADEGALPSLKALVADKRVLASFARAKVGQTSRLDVTLKARDGIKTSAVIVAKWAQSSAGPVARCVVFGDGRNMTPAGLAQAVTPSSRASGRLIDEMFLAAPFGIARLDNPDTSIAVIEDANPALVEMTGGKAIPGAPFLALFGDDPKTRQKIAEITEDDEGPMELALAGDDEKIIHLYTAIDRAGRCMVYLMDMTARKGLENELFQAQKVQVIGQLTSGIAHNLNNMLGIIRSNCDVLLGRHPVGDPSYSELHDINQSVVRGAGMIKQLMAFSRKQTQKPECLILSEMLSDFSILLRQILHETITFDLVHGRDVPPVLADRGQLESVIMNLATNARDAMLENGGGSLTIRTSRQEKIPAIVTAGQKTDQKEWALIEVVDTGSGMDKETMQRIFEPFFTTKEKGKGTGLGLASVFGIVKQSGGFLYPVSSLGEGTTFQVWLPAHHPDEAELAQSAEQAATPASEVQPSGLAGRGRILYVEDEAAMRSITVKILQNLGYDVFDAADGLDALDVAREHKGEIDLLISDVVMPGLDGPGLLKEARDYLGDARILFVSGFTKEEFSQTLTEDTEIGFLQKPIGAKDLAKTVKHELALLAQHRQNTPGA